MNRIVWLLIFALVVVSGCASNQMQEETQNVPTAKTTQSPKSTDDITVIQSDAPILVSNATPSSGIEPTPKPIEQNSAEKYDNDTDFSFVEYYIEDAENCRTVVDGAEYYFDTNYYIFQDYFPEFPLFKRNKDGWAEYMGTTGFSFQVNGDYIYIKSDVLQEDWPDGTLTRVVNLIDGSIYPAGRNIDIFVPSEGDRVYLTLLDNRIFIAFPSLEEDRVIDVEIPDKEQIEEETGKSLEKYDVFMSITDVEDGWIYFRYLIFEYEVSDLYEGNYRITTDGKKIEKTDEGELLEN